MQSSQSQKTLQGLQLQTVSTFASTSGELKIRQLQYFKKKVDLRTYTADRPFTQGKLSVTTHKLSKGRGLLPISVVEEVPQFFENFISTNRNYIQDIPNEETIKKTFRFKLPCIVADNENQHAQIHFLEGFVHSQTLIESYIQECQQRLQRSKKEALSIKQEMKQKEEDTNKEIDEFVVHCRQQSHRLQRMIKEDYVSHQSEQFRLNKQITILVRDKLQMEADIMQRQQEIYRMEIKLQGVECFDLQTDDVLLRTITQNNLRPDKSQYSFKSIIH